ncbi:type IV secretion system protein [Ehrlichia canis]|uniref:type IV secretion system protein n=1 Tax=Ehrlichia canis TaxID=944 RepID=UPI000C8514B2|nr:type IV secretion system protein [Ehrlichia canis]AUO54694.1 hypothetical protein C1I72_02175 [Ehrlichia canis]UKC52962.1 hypothetical protein s20019040002_000003 [Ehrlichia canis]UKC53899.1 hypothetical protein s20026770001_000003 [Ehrlichia canis]UKC54835.1 hypothetical protein s21009500007_000003 [Ehrlichia canis]
MCNFIKKHFVKLLLLLVITACESNQHPVPRCIPADVLSETKTASVSAYFNASSEDFIADDKSLGNILNNDQVVRWKYTGYVTDGNPIVLRVDGMWTAWADNASESDRGVTDYEKYNNILSSERICGPYNKIQKTFVPYGKSGCKVSCELITGVQDELERGAYGPPCWFKNGYGAYLLFKRPGDPEPNETLNHMRYPVSPVMHIGYKPLELAGSDALSTRDRKIMDSFCQEVKLEPGWKIYLKILDKHYYDNVGGYSVTFVEGIKAEERFSVFEWVRKNIRNELDKAGEHVFKHIVGNPVFKNFVFALLTLFLVFGALTYIFGMVQSPFSDVIVRILKMALMILLISPSSWEFFYNHLLNLFINGIDQIIAMINSHSASYNPTRPFAFLDEMIVDKIFSPVIWKIKIRALILADFSSIFAVLVIIIAVLIYIALCLYGCVIYLTAFVGITFLIGLFPLLLLGILFSQFKSLFDGWLTQCLSFSMQAILMFTLISLFGALIMNYYYRIFGFTTCYNEWLKVKVCILGSTGCVINRSVFGWTPGQIYDPKVIGLTTDFNLNDRKTSDNARYKFTGGGAYISVPPERIHKDFRYVDYPFLDPDSQTDGDPFGITVSKDSPFRQLSYYINALLASNEKYVAARLIKDIEDELEQLQKSGTINSDSRNKVLTIINNRRNTDKSQQKNALDKYQDEDFKSEIINSLINDVIGEAAQAPTPQDELMKQHDYNLILGIKAGYLVLWSEVGSLFLAALLIWQMRAFIQSVAVALAGGSMMSQTIANMYEGGFIKIFSGIPVLGVVFKKIDQGIDSLKFVTGNYITKTARRPLEALKRVPYLGKVVKFTSAATAPLTSSYNEYDRDFRNNFKTLNYARAYIGAHLGISPLNAMKYLGGHVAGSMFGTREGGLIHNILEDRAAALDSLKAHILGPEQYKPSPYLPNAGEDDDRNPFAKEKPHDAKETPHGNGDNRLLDENGNISVNRDNLSDALDAREQLKTMIGNTTDEAALQRMRYDLDRLDDALHKNLGNDFDRVTSAYTNSYTPVEHPKDLLVEGMSGLRVSSENLQGLGVSTVDELVQADNSLNVPLSSDVISSGTQLHGSSGAHLDVTPPVSDVDSLLSQQDASDSARVGGFGESISTSEHGVGVEGIHDSVLRDNAGLTTPLDVTSSMESVGAGGDDAARPAVEVFEDPAGTPVESQDFGSTLDDSNVTQSSSGESDLGSTSSMESVGADGDDAARAPVEVFEDPAGTPVESQDFGSTLDDSNVTQSSSGESDLGSTSSMEGVGADGDDAARAPVEVFEDPAGTPVESQDFGSTLDDSNVTESSSGESDLGSTSSLESVGADGDDAARAPVEVFEDPAGAPVESQDFGSTLDDSNVTESSSGESDLGSTSSLESVGADGDDAARAPVEVFEDPAGAPVESQDFGSTLDDSNVTESSSGESDLGSTSSMEGVGADGDDAARAAAEILNEPTSIPEDSDVFEKVELKDLSPALDDVHGLDDDITQAHDNAVEDHFGPLEEGNTMFSQDAHPDQNVDSGLEEETALHSGIMKQDEMDTSESTVQTDTTTPEDNIVQETDDSINLDVGVFEQTSGVLDLGSLENDVNIVGNEGILQQQAAESLLDDVPKPEIDDGTVLEKVGDEVIQGEESVFEKSGIQETEPYSTAMEQVTDKDVGRDGDAGTEKLFTTEDDTADTKVGASVELTSEGVVNEAVQDGFSSDNEGKLSEETKDDLVTQQEDKLEDKGPDDTDDVQGEDKQYQDVVDEDNIVEKTGDVSDQSDGKEDAESGVSDSEALAEGLIDLVSSGEESTQAQRIQVIHPVAGLSSRDKGVVTQDKSGSSKGSVGGKGIFSAQSDVKGEVKEKKKEPSKSKAKSPSKTKSPFITPKSLKNTFKFVMDECAKDFSSKVLESMDKIFGESQGGKQRRRKLSKEEISLAIEQLEAVIEGLKLKKAGLTDPSEIEAIEIRIKEAESAIRGLLNQE